MSSRIVGARIHGDSSAEAADRPGQEIGARQDDGQIRLRLHPGVRARRGESWRWPQWHDGVRAAGHRALREAAGYGNGLDGFCDCDADGAGVHRRGGRRRRAIGGVVDRCTGG